MEKESAFVKADPELVLNINKIVCENIKATKKGTVARCPNGKGFLGRGVKTDDGIYFDDFDKYSNNFHFFKFL